MKTGKLIKTTLLVGATLLVTSCEIYPNGYSSVTYSTDGYSSSVAWTAASYDANGFPIYGYSYGRPVYGYTVSGSPIFSINLLYAGCYVPSWKPAPWCTHHHHYPTGCHHAARPPKYDHGHKPHVRPSMHAPIHKNPQSVLGKPGHHGKPDHHAKPRPADKPNHIGKPIVRPDTIQRPSIQHSKPTVTRPSTIQRPSTTTRPQVSRPSTATRPSTTTRPQVSRPSTVTRPSTTPRPQVSRPSTATRPSTIQRSEAQQPRHSETRPGTSRRRH